VIETSSPVPVRWRRRLGAVAMLIARHPMRVALALIICMLSLAGIYALLGVHVIAVFQVLIYVGAVMVFMVYVILLIDVRDSAFTRPLFLAARPRHRRLRGADRGAVHRAVDAASRPPGPQSAPFGCRPFSEVFLNEYWLYFELVSVLLVAAVVAAIAVVKIGIGRRG
jgi:NADH-quinone oxidoreductase subunit J